jgi:hypothetical protein
MPRIESIKMLRSENMNKWIAYSHQNEYDSRCALGSTASFERIKYAENKQQQEQD